MALADEPPVIVTEIVVAPAGAAIVSSAVRTRAHNTMRCAAPATNPRIVRGYMRWLRAGEKERLFEPAGHNLITTVSSFET